MSMVISVLNQKGGVGKTTLATNLAVGMVKNGAKVLLIDSDPQGSARDWRAANPEGDLPLIALDRPTLLKGLPSLSRGYDLVVIDGAPQLKELAAATIRSSDRILIPVQPSPYDIWATADLVELINARKELVGETLRSAFIVSRAIQGTRLSKEVTEALSHYSTDVFQSHTTQRVSYASSATSGQSVFDTPDAKAIEEIETIVEEIFLWLS